MPAFALDERAAHLVELAIAYGDTHFDSATNLVTDAAGIPNVADHSMPYALGLLEKHILVPRACVVINAVLGAQDASPSSPTRGQFRWVATPGAACSPRALYQVAPLLARVYKVHAERVGEELTRRIRAALELSLMAAQRTQPRADSTEELLRQATLAQVGSALGQPSHVARAVTVVSQWLRQVAKSGRNWTPSPSGDTLRLLALQRIWEVTPEASRGPVDQALRLLYWDFAQRVHPEAAALAGAATPCNPDEYLDAHGISSYLIYRDFGLRLPPRVRPFAVAIAVAEYRPGPDICALVRPVRGRQPYVVETNAACDPHPVQTTTYMAPAFTLGTITGWCVPESVPVFMTFAGDETRPTAYFFIHGGPAHLSTFQYGNFAICSFNFDRIGVGKQLQAWVSAALGTVKQIEGVCVYGQQWNGEPVAVGERATVALKRAGVYIGLTLLECGPTEKGKTMRRKPGVLEWQNAGENATLTLTIYARAEDYALRRPADDLRAGVAIQIWDGDQFDDLEDFARWLDTAKITQRYAPATIKIPGPRKDVNPVLDRGKPQPKPQYKRLTQKVHTIEYAYQRGKGNRFTLIEDLRYEKVLSRQVNDEPLDDAPLWRTPAFTWLPGQSLERALAPPKPEPATPSSP